MRGRSLQVYQGRPKPGRRRRGQKYRGRKSGGLGLVSMMFGAVVLAGASFGAVFLDWGKLLSGSHEDIAEVAEPQTRALAPASLPKPSKAEGRLRDTTGSIPRGGEMTVADAKNIAVAVSRKGAPGLLEDLESKARAIKTLGVEKNLVKVDLAGVRLRLEVPKGQCPLDPAQQADARVIGMMSQVYRGELRALHGFADCNELKAWRAGERGTLSHYGDYLVPVSGVDKTAPASSRALMDTACRTMREYNGEYNGWKDAGLKERIEKALEPYKMNQVRLIGVIDQDDAACYFATVQKTKTENGETKTQINVVALTLIGGKMLYIDLYSVLENDSTLQALLRRQKANVVRNIAANGS